MHIPDGFLSTPVWAALDLAAVPAVGYLAKKAQSDLAETRIPLLGVTGAFVFAAQMINFPVGLGTSGHLVGGALLACTLGPAAAAIVMTAILAIQALVFQDGGVLALGANVLNMAVAGVLAGYLPYRLWGRGKWRGASIFLGGALSVLTSACLALAELLLSGVPMRPALLGLSMALFVVSAALEGAITLAVVRAVERMNPGCLAEPENSWKPGMAFFATGAVALALVGILIASPAPDGLEKFLADMGLSSKTGALFSTPLADYETAIFRSGWLRKASAGLAGLAVVFGVCFGLGRVLLRRRNA
jgi:cobalt/nickel transport system permease protein